MLATDHAPHAPEKKMRELDQAPNGIIGLETLLPICVDAPDRAGPPDLAAADRQADDQPGPACWASTAARCKPGADADVTIIDPKAEWTIDATQFRSKSRNCPSTAGKSAAGCLRSIVSGEVKLEMP